LGGSQVFFKDLLSLGLKVVYFICSQFHPIQIVGPAHNQLRKKIKTKFYKQRNILKLNETWKRIIEKLELKLEKASKEGGQYQFEKQDKTMKSANE